MELVYNFEDFKELQKDKYLFQFVQNKTLTKISHRHNFYEIVFITEGKVTQIVNDTSIKMTKNSFIILSPSDTHSFQAQSKDTKVVSLSVLPEKFLEIERATDVTPAFATLFRYEDNTDTLINELILCSSQTRTQMMNKFLIALFFACWNTSNTQSYIPANLENALRRMSEEENLKGGVQRWGELAGYSRAQLIRLSKKYYNDTPERILQRLKMRMAEKYLKSTTLAIEEIANLCGFESLSRFYVVFKKKYDVTPAQFREKIKYLSNVIEK